MIPLDKSLFHPSPPVSGAFRWPQFFAPDHAPKAIPRSNPMSAFNSVAMPRFWAVAVTTRFFAIFFFFPPLGLIFFHVWMVETSLLFANRDVSLVRVFPPPIGRPER